MKIDVFDVLIFCYFASWIVLALIMTHRKMTREGYYSEKITIYTLFSKIKKLVTKKETEKYW